MPRHTHITYAATITTHKKRPKVMAKLNAELDWAGGAPSQELGWGHFSTFFFFCVRSQRNLRPVATHSLAATISQQKKVSRLGSFTPLLFYHPLPLCYHTAACVCVFRLLLVVHRGESQKETCQRTRLHVSLSRFSAVSCRFYNQKSNLLTMPFLLQ